MERSSIHKALSPSTRPHLSVALMSDPKGADLRPYLSQVAKTIRKKWVQTSRLSFSAQREVNLQFSIDRSGRVRNVIICCISGFADSINL